jgi:hypothetical protein
LQNGGQPGQHSKALPQKEKRKEEERRREVAIARNHLFP